MAYTWKFDVSGYVSVEADTEAEAREKIQAVQCMTAHDTRKGAFGFIVPLNRLLGQFDEHTGWAVGDVGELSAVTQIRLAGEYPSDRQ